MILIKGDRDLNETKVKKLIGALEMNMATEEELKTITDGTFGSLGPVNIKAKIMYEKIHLKSITR